MAGYCTARLFNKEFIAYVLYGWKGRAVNVWSWGKLRLPKRFKTIKGANREIAASTFWASIIVWSASTYVSALSSSMFWSNSVYLWVALLSLYWAITVSKAAFSVANFFNHIFLASSLLSWAVYSSC